MKASQSFRRLLLALVGLSSLYFMGACGSAVVTSTPNTIPTSENPPAPIDGPLAPVLGQATLNAFILGDYPADIDIPNIEGLKNIAFITSFFPAGVIAVDLNSNPLQALPGKGLPSLAGINNAGFPNVAFFADATHAYLLTSTTLILFNPSNATVYDTVDLTVPLNLSSPLARINPDGSSASPVSGSFTPSYPSSVIALGSKVLVGFSNLNYTGFSLTSATQGMVRVFDMQNDSLAAATPEYFVTSGYNTTGLTALSNGKFLVTNSGITQFTPDFSNQLPVTQATVDLMDSQGAALLGSLDLALSTPAFRSWAVTPDGSKAFIGSASGGFVMEIGLSPTFQVIRGVNNPIVITDAHLGTDYIDDVVMANDGGGIYPISFNHSSVYAVDLTGDSPLLTEEKSDLSAPGNPGLTGAGPGAMRPGQVGVDFNGPSLFVMTASPGSLAAINTYK